MVVVRIDLNAVVDWESFHAALAGALSFPAYYGRNGDAFIDCLGDITAGRDSARLLTPRGTLTLDLDDVSAFRQRCAGMVEALCDWVAFVNARDLDQNERPARSRVLLAYR